MKDAIRECYSTVIRELAAIVNAPQTDDMLEKELLPRDPVMENVSRIREAMDKLSAAQHADARGGGVDAEIANGNYIDIVPGTFVRHPKMLSGRTDLEHGRYVRITAAPEPPTAEVPERALPTERRIAAVELLLSLGYQWRDGAWVATTDAGREDVVAPTGIDRSITELQELVRLANDYDLDEMQVASLETAIESMYLRRQVTPAGGEDGRDARQCQVAEWCASAFGADHAASIPQRGIRHAEEAIEAAQAAGCDPAMVHRLVDHVYSRAPGELRQEIGGSGITLLALAAAAGASADGEESRELARVLSKPLEHFAQRNAAKNAAGFNVAAQAESGEGRSDEG